MISIRTIAGLLLLTTTLAAQPPAKRSTDRSFVGTFGVDLQRWRTEATEKHSLKINGSDVPLSPKERDALLVAGIVLLSDAKLVIASDGTYTMTGPLAVTEGTWVVKRHRLIGTPRRTRPSKHVRVSGSIRLTSDTLYLERREDGLRLLNKQDLSDGLPLRQLQPTASKSKP